MSFDPVPWFVGGGAEHSPAVARLLAYAATRGAAGVVTAGDLKVIPLPTPGASVRVNIGSAIIPNTYPGGGRQSYIVRAPSVTDLPIAATTTVARSDLVVARIDDPEFGGQTPADVRYGPYTRPVVIQNVPANTVDIPVSVNYPAVVLARIDLPVNTSVITSGMIADLRQLASPRSKREVLTLTPAGTEKATSTDTWVNWPNWSPSVRVPAWATRAIVRADANSVMLDATGASSNRLRAVLGFGTTREVWLVARGGAGDRYNGALSDTLIVPPSVQGTVITPRLQVYRYGASTPNVNIVSDSSSSFAFDIEFQEAVV